MTALLPPLEHAVSNGCLNCPPKPVKLNLNWNVHPGFGVVTLTCDGEPVWGDFWGGDGGKGYQRHGRVAEAAARKDPERDWRLVIDGPMSGVTYQRHGLNEWVAVEKNLGFA